MVRHICSRFLDSQVLQNVQKLIEELQLQNYSNIKGWTKVLGSRVEEILIQRLIKLVEEWISQFEEWPNKGTALIQNGLVLEIQVGIHDRTGGPWNFVGGGPLILADPT